MITFTTVSLTGVPCGSTKRPQGWPKPPKGTRWATGPASSAQEVNWGKKRVFGGKRTFPNGPSGPHVQSTSFLVSSPHTGCCLSRVSPRAQCRSCGTSGPVKEECGQGWPGLPAPGAPTRGLGDSDGSLQSRPVHGPLQPLPGFCGKLGAVCVPHGEVGVPLSRFRDAFTKPDSAETLPSKGSRFQRPSRSLCSLGTPEVLRERTAAQQGGGAPLLGHPSRFHCPCP